MSNFWDLYCATCKKDGNVIHWNHGDEALAKLISYLPTIALLKPIVADVAGARRSSELTLRFESGPEWQGNLIDFAFEHLGHTILARSEAGYCHVCDAADYDAMERDPAGKYTSVARDACRHIETASHRPSSKS
jgi:hypothetical protein